MWMKFERPDVVHRWLTEAEGTPTDLPDLLIALGAAALGCREGLTFDKKAAKLPFFRRL